MKSRDLAAIAERVRRAEPVAVIAEADGGWEWTVRDGRTGDVMASGSTDTRGIADLRAASAIAETQKRRLK